MSFQIQQRAGYEARVVAEQRTVSAIAAATYTKRFVFAMNTLPQE